MIVAVGRGAVGERTVIVSASATTWSAVRISAASVDDDARALAVVGAHVGVAALGFDQDERRPDQRVGALATGRWRGHGLERRGDRVADVTPRERRGPRLEGRPGEHPDEHQPRAEDDRCGAPGGPAAARSPGIRALGLGIRRRRLGCWRGRLVEQVGHGDAASSGVGGGLGR